jgi:DNA-binding CsgD family transcriptional regulator
VRREETLALLAGLGSRGRRKMADLIGPGSLSAREREVARLASEGCSAREIAERLFIGERTVETHLANAYAKLGVTSKLDLVRRASELGI